MSADRHRFSSGFRRSIAVPLSAALVMATGTGAWYTFGGDGLRSPGVSPEGAAVASLARSLDLPWPAEGQASAEVEGIGSLGTQGEQIPVPIASITKVMTAYVILTGHPMPGGGQGEEVTADQQAADESFSTTESTAPVVAGHRYTQRQLLELMMLPSGNNVARLLARWDSGDQERFTVKMNKAAAALGMTRTTYTGASGIETDTKSTAADQMKLAHAVMKNEAFRKIVATPAITAPGADTPIRKSNKLLGKDGVIGLKTGSSTPAGGNLMWAATQEVAGVPRLILGVVLHQQADTNPTAGMAAAFEASHTLITAIRTALPHALTTQSPKS